MTDKKLGIQLVNAGRSKKYTLGTIDSIIQHASSLVFNNVEAKKCAACNRANGELFYGRRGTLAHFSSQRAMYELEGGASCILFPCRAAAVTNSILAFVERGDHVLMANTAYGPSQDFCSKALSKLGITISWFDPLIGADIVKHLQSNTKVVSLEPPGPIIMGVHDAPAIVAAVRSVVPGAIITIDNTWAAGVLFKALDFGIDVSIQTATKYLVGRSDAMIGTAVYNTRCQGQLRENAYLMGQMIDADAAYVAGHGLRTLGVRLRQHHESGLKVAKWLAEHPQVARVNHPVLPGSKDHELWERDFTGSSGLLSSVFKRKLNGEELANYLGNFSLFSMAYLWGGYGSLILANQPEHIAAIHPRGKIDFSRTLIRLHIGLEGVDNLIADPDASFARIVQHCHFRTVL